MRTMRHVGGEIALAMVLDIYKKYERADSRISGTVGQLIVKYPLHVNATGGYNRTPVVAERHFQLA